MADLPDIRADLSNKKLEKYAVAYGLAGLATLALSYYRASKIDAATAAGTPVPYVWPGFGTTPPGAVQGALETVAFWPYALLKMVNPPAASTATKILKRTSSSP